MNDRKRILVPSVNTIEAFVACVNEKVLVFGMENPLYREIKTNFQSIEGVEDYYWEDYPYHQVLLLLNKQKYSDDKYDIHFPALHFPPMYI